MPVSHPGRVRLGISACLLGERVRYDGGHKRDAFLVDALANHVEWVPVCPEVELGLGVPRDAIRLVGEARPRGSSGSAPARTSPTGCDLRHRARPRLAALDLDGYVLKRASPSCGLWRVRVYRDGGAPSADGRGLFASALVHTCRCSPSRRKGG